MRLRAVPDRTKTMESFLKRNGPAFDAPYHHQAGQARLLQL